MLILLTMIRQAGIKYHLWATKIKYTMAFGGGKGIILIGRKLVRRMV